VYLLLALLLNALALIITAKLVPGFYVVGFEGAILAAIVLGVVNTFIKPLLLFLTAPINFLTLGLFTFVVNAVMLAITSALVGAVAPGTFYFDSFWWTGIIAAIVLSIISTILSMVLKDVVKAK
jgi:putative membrane protein